MGAQIYNLVEELPTKIKFPEEKNNAGRTFGLLVFWKRVKDLADKKYDALMKQSIEDNLVGDPKKESTPGDYVIGSSEMFSVNLNVSIPRKEFNVDWFCNEMNRRYKVPVANIKAILDQARQPGVVQNRTVTVREKGTEQ